MTGPDDVPVGDLYDEASEYMRGWTAIQTEVTDPQPIGTLFVVLDGREDRDPIQFGFCR